ncbi:molybdopterin synthase subunit MoaE [Limimaricola soesokkakensis]|uniref:Molybdopterin synthase catalytic subunit n=1 Tax=Limimaricola soesokkakensis TaxID=1343159 RepID=A0A1X6ZA63_9RHOB|nr:molybdenum cofactor biosynthesis protein MoaE [Limimaricola soesokkakensis]PSK86611.1 molybdopterin synthase subunit MoaE [Limimaricola soesokkakensis]SLN43364.1 Molybdopterin synthase catalytic subunit [Limimaricola soesokkakensis]
MKISVQEGPFDAGAELDAFSHGRHEVGAIVSFTGIVRDRDGGLVRMEIEHYPGMTEKAIAEIAEQAKARWQLADLLVIHRHGALPLGQPIMMVATAAAHRRAAFDAAEYLMDYLKSRAPFWKKEVTRTGEHWVEATPEDEDALSRW